MVQIQRRKQWPYYLVIVLFLMTFLVQDLWFRKKTNHQNLLTASNQQNDKKDLRSESSDSENTNKLGQTSSQLQATLVNQATIINDTQTDDISRNLDTIPKDVHLDSAHLSTPALSTPSLIPPAPPVTSDRMLMPPATDDSETDVSTADEEGTAKDNADKKDRVAIIPDRDRLNGDILEKLGSNPLLEGPSISNPGKIERTRPAFPVLPMLPEVPSQLWPEFTALQQQVDYLKGHCSVATAWSNQLQRIIKQIRQTKSFTDADLGRLLKELEQAVENSPAIVKKCKNSTQRTLVRRVYYSMLRRIEVWNAIVAVAKKQQQIQPADAEQHKTARRKITRQMVLCIDDVQSMTKKSPYATQWQKYLLLETLREMNESKENQQREIARKALVRIQHAKTVLSKSKKTPTKPLDQLDKQLRLVATEAIDLSQLVRDMEQYELTQSSVLGKRISAQQKKLKWSKNKQSQELSKNIDEYYRNANLRVAVTSELINLLLPQPKPSQAMVNEMIAGVPVRGRRTTSTTLRIRLLEDSNRVKVGLEASGVVQSETKSSSGPAVFHNDGESTFLAKKLVTFDQKGIKRWPAVASADTKSTLGDFDTDYDSIPLINSVVRSLVKRQYDKKSEQAKSDVQYKVSQEAKARLDKESESRIKTIEKRFEKQWINPIESLFKKPTPIELSSTKHRVVARYRLASGTQLGSHTPRPRAPSNSLLSMQIHESVFNNAIENLDLAGNIFYLDELVAKINKIFGNKSTELPEDVPVNMAVQFAKEDPIQVSMKDGKVTIVLQLAIIDTGEASWKDMKIIAVYEPTLKGMQATLERKQPVAIAGANRKLRARLALRAIFTKVFSTTKPMKLIPEQVAKDPRFSNMKIGYLKIDSGWLGLAITPDRTKHKGVKIERSSWR